MKLHGIAIRTMAITALGLSLTLVGCGGGSTSTTADNTETANPSSAPNANPTQAAGQATMVDAGIETEAAQSVAIFLDSLRKGDERAANGVLSTKARQELAKTTYEMQPLGTPEGQYKIGRVLFPFEEKNIALVECTWNEPPASGEPQMEIVCEVYRESDGWRISGIGVSVPGMEEALVLDFEDAAALQATIDAATGQSSQQPAGQVATGEMTSQAQQTLGLPAFPTDSPADYPADGGYQQIALPPLSGAPVNR